MMICVSDSAATPHMETYDERKISVSDYRRRICLSSQIICASSIIGMISIRAIKAVRDIHECVDALSLEIENKIGLPISMHSGNNTGLVVSGEVDMDCGAPTAWPATPSM